MGLLKHFRSKSRLKQSSKDGTSSSYQQNYPPVPSSHPARYGRDFTSRLTAPILERIFMYVCPHCTDFTYEASERSQIGDGCMLCDLRDIASCARTSRKWYSIAQVLLYRSIRIDAVHYCALEEELAERRNKSKKHFRSKSSVDPGEIPNIRLGLLARTVRESPKLADQVLFLKLPYMTRETAKSDLARTVSALPALRYVDLPDGFYSGEQSCMGLRQELLARCPDIRKMTYRTGSEESLELLAQRYWQGLEMLEISGLAVEPATLRIVLASLPRLHELSLADLNWLDDTVFQPSPRLPDFPPLQLLKLENIPSVTFEGLKHYLDIQQYSEMLYSLTLQDTGIRIQDLHSVLWAASSLEHLSVSQKVSKSLILQSQRLPPLASTSLRTLHFEILSSEDVHGLQKPAESYYEYLASSIQQGGMPALQTIYVRDQGFPELLLLPIGKLGFGSDSGSVHSNSSSLSPDRKWPLPATGFKQELEIFSKGVNEVEWVVTAVAPSSNAKHRQNSSSGGRPLSWMSAAGGLGPQWAQGGFGGEARKSVIVGNGFGGFLAVPQEEAPRPMTADGSPGGKFGSVGSKGNSPAYTQMGDLLKPPSMATLSSHQDKRSSRHDLWR